MLTLNFFNLKNGCVEQLGIKSICDWLQQELPKIGLHLCLCLIQKYHKPVNNKYLKRIIDLYNSDLYHLLAYSLIS